jgi:hypothetical protein
MSESSRWALQGICQSRGFHAPEPPGTLHREWTGAAYFMGISFKTTPETQMASRSNEPVAQGLRLPRPLAAARAIQFGIPPNE